MHSAAIAQTVCGKEALMRLVTSEWDERINSMGRTGGESRVRAVTTELILGFLC
jgi:hypothetical protein